MEAIAEEGAVVAQALVEREGVLAELGGIELAGVDRGLEALGRRLTCRHGSTPGEGMARCDGTGYAYGEGAGLRRRR